MTKREHNRISRAYESVVNKYPEVINKRVLELLTRDYIKRKKLIVVSLWFICSAICIFGSDFIKSLHPGLIDLIQLAGAAAIIISVCKFAKFLHDPLTPSEEKELIAIETAEKTGTPIERSQYDREAYQQYLQIKNGNSSLIKRCMSKIFRISVFIYLVVAVCLGVGIKTIVQGVDNIATFEERNKNATYVTAFIDNIESYQDDDGETQHRVYWKYRYNQKPYIFKGYHYSSSMQIGDSKRILIDSKNPDVVIKNNGAYSILLGSGLCVLGLFILIYSIFQARKDEDGVSILHICWIGFAVAAVGFTIMGIFELTSGSARGIFCFLGTIVFCFAAWLFLQHLNQNTD